MDDRHISRHWREQCFRLGMLLRQVGSNDPKVISTIVDDVPRHLFMAEAFWDKAYENVAIPIGEGQTISAPEVVCQMTSALELEPQHRVLEIGTGSGYQAAVLSKLVKQLVSVERFPTLAQMASRRLEKIGCRNVEQIVGDGFKGAPEEAPFDRIILTAAPENVPPYLIQQLVPGGVLVGPIGRQNEDQYLIKCQRSFDVRDIEITTSVIGKVRFVPMVASKPQR